MSFGFSPSDIITLVTLATETFRGWKNACGDYADITGSLDTLLILLERVEDEAEQEHTALVRNRKDRDELNDIVSACHRTVQELGLIISKYRSLGLGKSREKNWDKIRFGNKNLDSLKAKLLQHQSAISAYLNAIGLGALSRIERDLHALPDKIQRTVDGLAAEIRAGRREGSIMTTYEDDEKEVWKQFRRELIGDGMKSSFVHKFKPQIRRYLRSLADQGLLEEAELSTDEDATPERSGSQTASESPESGSDGSEVAQSIVLHDQGSPQGHALPTLGIESQSSRAIHKVHVPTSVRATDQKSTSSVSAVGEALPVMNRETAGNAVEVPDPLGDSGNAVVHSAISSDEIADNANCSDPKHDRADHSFEERPRSSSNVAVENDAPSANKKTYQPTCESGSSSDTPLEDELPDNVLMIERNVPTSPSVDTNKYALFDSGKENLDSAVPKPSGAEQETRAILETSLARVSGPPENVTAATETPRADAVQSWPRVESDETSWSEIDVPDQDRYAVAPLTMENLMKVPDDKRDRRPQNGAVVGHVPEVIVSFRSRKPKQILVNTAEGDSNSSDDPWQSARISAVERKKKRKEKVSSAANDASRPPDHAEELKSMSDIRAVKYADGISAKTPLVHDGDHGWIPSGLPDMQRSCNADPDILASTSSPPEVIEERLHRLKEEHSDFHLSEEEDSDSWSRMAQDSRIRRNNPPISGVRRGRSHIRDISPVRDSSSAQDEGARRNSIGYNGPPEANGRDGIGFKNTTTNSLGNEASDAAAVATELASNIFSRHALTYLGLDFQVLPGFVFSVKGRLTEDDIEDLLEADKLGLEDPWTWTEIDTVTDHDFGALKTIVKKKNSADTYWIRDPEKGMTTWVPQSQVDALAVKQLAYVLDRRLDEYYVIRGSLTNDEIRELINKSVSVREHRAIWQGNKEETPTFDATATLRERDADTKAFTVNYEIGGIPERATTWFPKNSFTMWTMLAQGRVVEQRKEHYLLRGPFTQKQLDDAISINDQITLDIKEGKEMRCCEVAHLYKAWNTHNIYKQPDKDRFTPLDRNAWERNRQALKTPLYYLWLSSRDFVWHVAGPAPSDYVYVPWAGGLENLCSEPPIA